MKNLINTIILILLLWSLGGNTFAQIISNNPYNYSFTITPTGIIGGNMTHPNTLSSTNIALGESALKDASTITNNTAIGSYALSYAALNLPYAYSGNNNTAVGTSALQKNTSGYNNAAFGEYTMVSPFGGASGSENSIFGENTMYANSSGNNNAAFGHAALQSNSIGNDNAVFGASAALFNQTSNNQAAFGGQSLFYHKTGDGNVAFGVNTLYLDESGTNNVAFGDLTLQHNVSGISNTAFGSESLVSNKEGGSNLTFGANTLSNNNGQSNIVLGDYSTVNNKTGSNNVVAGYQALWTNVSGSGNVAIGSYAAYNETGSNKLYIDSNQAPSFSDVTLLGGDFSARKVCINCNMITTGVNDFNTRIEAFQVQGDAFKKLGSGNWVFPSDKRLKTNIISLKSHDILAKILQLQGVNYDLIANPERGTQYGFIAQDLQNVFPTKVYENKTGYLSASYGGFTPIFVEALKALNEKIESLEQIQPDIKAITANLEKLEARLKVKE